jgi:2-C-methyl-D-erythritol 2,4-cyclodiphosphate synthase
MQRGIFDRKDFLPVFMIRPPTPRQATGKALAVGVQPAARFISGLSQMHDTMRIGMGYDVHALVEGRPLILGGVSIPFSTGLAGHSDADVLTHALCDALLGAVGQGDIGLHFPDHADEFKAIRSLRLLERVARTVRNAGWTLNNADATVVAQAPRIAPYRVAMQQNLADVLQVPVTRINIKATTTEGLGWIGRGEGIAATCVVLLSANV